MNYTREHIIPITIDFLSMYFITDNMDKYCREFCLKYGIDYQKLKKNKKSLFQMYQSLFLEFGKDMSDIIDDARYYFAAPDKDGKCEQLYNFIILHTNLTIYYTQDFDKLYELLNNLSEEEFNEHFSSTLYAYNNTIIKGEDSTSSISDSFSVASYVLSLDLPDEVKIKLQNLYVNRKNHTDKLMSLMKKVAAFLIQHEKLINAEIDKFYKYWKPKYENRSFYDFIAESIPFFSTFEECPTGYSLYPSLFINIISLSLPDDDDKKANSNPAVLTIGLMFDDSLLIQFQNYNEEVIPEQAIDALKQIADKTRFDILRFIKSKPAYGSEIAEHLGITTATVSHHMGTLYAAGLINIYKENSRIYYSINTDNIEKYIRYYEKSLL